MLLTFGSRPRFQVEAFDVDRGSLLQEIHRHEETLLTTFFSDLANLASEWPIFHSDKLTGMELGLRRNIEPCAEKLMNVLKIASQCVLVGDVDASRNTPRRHSLIAIKLLSAHEDVIGKEWQEAGSSTPGRRAIRLLKHGGVERNLLRQESPHQLFVSAGQCVHGPPLSVLEWISEKFPRIEIRFFGQQWHVVRRADFVLLGDT